MESDGGDSDDVLEQFGVHGENDECEGGKVRRTRVSVRRRHNRLHYHQGFFFVMFFICMWGGWRGGPIVRIKG